MSVRSANVVTAQGTLSFEDAYELFREMVTAGEAAGAASSIPETLTDLYEVKAAVLAAKEHTKLPIWVTMTFEENEYFPSSVLRCPQVVVTAGCARHRCTRYQLLARSAELLHRRRDDGVDGLADHRQAECRSPRPAHGCVQMTAEMFGAEMLHFAQSGALILGGCCGFQS